MPNYEVKANIPSAFDLSQEQTQDIAVPYSQDELNYRGFLEFRLSRARDQREDTHIELDDDTYSTYYLGNAKGASSYNPPRQNREDSRVVTGTTLEKENTLLSTLLNFNFDASLRPYDRFNNEIYELGETMEDLVVKSRKMERYEDKRRMIYKELLDQGTCFVEEVKVERIVYDKKMRENEWAMGGVTVSNIKWDTKLKKLYSECECNLLAGTSVYLGNVKEFFIDKQPYAFIRDEIHYDEAKMLYGDWDRFKYVPRRVQFLAGEAEERLQYRDWSVADTSDDYVEVIKYQDPLNNEFMILLNGVMMLPIGFPLTAISPSGAFTFAKGDAEPISRFFAYSKSIPAKTKVDQEVLDEMIRMILLKMKKSLMPPVANMSNKVLSRKIFLPAAIINGVNPDTIREIGKNDGPTAAEFNTFQLMKEIINEKSVDPVFSGETAGDLTATEIIQRKQQQMLKLGQTVIGVINLEIQLVRLRIHNILANWTLPIDQRVDEVRKELRDLYRTFDVETTFEDTGRKGRRIVSFDKEASESYSSEDGGKKLMQLENQIKDKTGQEIRFTFMDPDKVRNLEATWEINITPTEKTSSELDRVMFVQNLAAAMNMFGPQSVNMDYAKQRFATLAKEDPEKFFVQTGNSSQQPLQNPAQDQNQAPGGQQGGANPLQQLAGQAGGAQQPSLNSLLGQ